MTAPSDATRGPRGVGSFCRLEASLTRITVPRLPPNHNNRGFRQSPHHEACSGSGPSAINL
jgi:hypothetical protein